MLRLILNSFWKGFKNIAHHTNILICLARRQAVYAIKLNKVIKNIFIR